MTSPRVAMRSAYLRLAGTPAAPSRAKAIHARQAPKRRLRNNRAQSPKPTRAPVLAMVRFLDVRDGAPVSLRAVAAIGIDNATLIAGHDNHNLAVNKRWFASQRLVTMPIS